MSRLVVCLLVLFCVAIPAHADDVKSKIKMFCNDGLTLTQKSINLSIKQIVTIAGTDNSVAVLDSLGTLEISMMRTSCNLFVAQMITQQQFLDTQTKVLQFALDAEELKATVENNTVASGRGGANNTPTGGSPAAPASTNPPKPSVPTNPGASATPVAQNGSPKNKNSKPASNDQADPGVKGILKVAQDLGVNLTSNPPGSQSMSFDPVGDGVNHMILIYSPIPIQQ
jgi:hypothetical protein